MEPKTIDIQEPIDCSYCIPLELRDEQIKINISKVKERVVPSPDLIREPIAIVGFAPSLEDTWPELKKFKYIMTCSGAHKFLVEHGIVPTYHLDLDPRPHKVEMLGQPQHGTEYLIASTIHPNYLDALKGYNVKLWHIFANEGDGARVLPRGEWSITGGSSVGLRCMTMARFLGFQDMHIFGMDGSFREKGGTHTTEHPNAPKAHSVTEYNGRKFLTTPSMLFVGKQTFHEMDSMSDCKFTFYGDGLVQEMAKDYVPSRKGKNAIGYSKPEIISQEYLDLNRKLHESNPRYGMGGAKHRDTILKLSKELGTTSILDFGCGKGQLAKSLPFPIWEYDPAIPEKSAPPNPADIVVCTDVLEHVEPDKLIFVLDDLKFLVKKVGYFVICTHKAVKTYANGKNTHLIIQDADWWSNTLSKYFDIGKVLKDEHHVTAVVGPKTPSEAVVSKEPQVASVNNGGVECKFYTPNNTCAWRANTLLTKEPVTTAWVNSIPAGSVMFDVGANVGGYSVLAGTRKVKVYSFEPEAENFALLVKNLMLNGLDPNAFCMALSDARQIGTLKLSRPSVGGSCHQFLGSKALKLDRKSQQGCVSFTIDELVEGGLPVPDYIKIDVDGSEPDVVRGAHNTLKSGGVKSLLVEVDAGVPEHAEMVKYLLGIGYSFSQEQVDAATRKDGPFKGCAEYLFTLSPAAVEEKSIVSLKPFVRSNELFPWAFCENVFSEDFYAQIMENMPDQSEYMPISQTRGVKGYDKRFTADPKSPFWVELFRKMRDGKLKRELCNLFGVENPQLFNDECLLIRDFSGYSIGPHTDSAKKVITALFYLPRVEIPDAGTSIYVPKEEGFTCKGGPHYDFAKFTKVRSMPFRPNSAFIFLKTDNSFHGVEPCEGTRDVLLYDIGR